MAVLLSRIYNKVRTMYWQTRTNLCRAERLKDVIFFESKPDLSDNTKAVFDEMLRRGLNKQYKLVWMLFGSDSSRETKGKNIYYLPQWDAQLNYYSKVAKAKVFCNAFLEKEAKDQLCVYLSHGTALKDIRAHYRLPDWVDYCIAASPMLEESHAEVLSFDRSKTVGLGFPRNDALINGKLPMKEILNTTHSKVVVWYPTFRQHNCVKYTTIRNPIPLLDDMDCAKKLNDAAILAGVTIVIKPHFAQDTQYIREMNLSNIRFIDDRFFADHNTQSYEFVGSCDAMITDYSSIYFDYTLCDKPIAAVWSDIEEYKKKPGLVEEYEYLSKGMEKVYTLDELIGFINRVGKGVDLLQAERREIRDYANYSVDSGNAKRVVDFIMEQMDGRDK